MILFLKFLISAIANVFVYHLESNKSLIGKAIDYFNIRLTLKLTEEQKENLHKHLFLVITAVLTILSSEFIDTIQYNLKKPVVNIQYLTNNAAPGQIILKVEKNSAPLQDLRISVPVFGRVVKIEDLSNLRDAVTSIKQVSGHQDLLCRNDVELLIERITDVKELYYKITFESVSDDIKDSWMNTIRSSSFFDEKHKKAKTLDEMLNIDMFSFSYTWVVGGENHTENKWVSKITKNFVKKPDDKFRTMCMGTELTPI